MVIPLLRNKPNNEFELVRKKLKEEFVRIYLETKDYILLEPKKGANFQRFLASSDTLLKENLIDPIRKVLRKAKYDIQPIDILKTCILIACRGKGSWPGFTSEYFIRKELGISQPKLVLNKLISLGFVDGNPVIVNINEAKKAGELKSKYAGLDPRGSRIRELNMATKKLYDLLFFAIDNYYYFKYTYVVAALIYRPKDQAVLLQEHHGEKKRLVAIPNERIPYYLPGPRRIDEQIFYNDEESRDFLREYLEKTYNLKVVKIGNIIVEVEDPHGVGRPGEPNQILKYRAYEVEVHENSEDCKKPESSEFDIDDKGEDGRVLKAMWLNVYKAAVMLPHSFSRYAVHKFVIGALKY